MSLETTTTKELSERYVSQLEVYENLLKVLDVTLQAMNRIDKEVIILENELMTRGAEIKEIA